jgi:hypothetical protein
VSRIVTASVTAHQALVYGCGMVAKGAIGSIGEFQSLAMKHGVTEELRDDLSGELGLTNAIVSNEKTVPKQVISDHVVRTVHIDTSLIRCLPNLTHEARRALLGMSLLYAYGPSINGNRLRTGTVFSIEKTSLTIGRSRPSQKDMRPDMVNFLTMSDPEVMELLAAQVSADLKAVGYLMEEKIALSVDGLLFKDAVVKGNKKEKDGKKGGKKRKNGKNGDQGDEGDDAAPET